jgi:hypothetical protein
MKTSGATAKATTADTAVELISATTTGRPFTWLSIINEGSVAGFFSIDGGTTWARLPAGPSAVSIPVGVKSLAVQIKRVAGGTNLSGVWGFLSP